MGSVPFLQRRGGVGDGIHTLNQSAWLLEGCGEEGVYNVDALSSDYPIGRAEFVEKM